ncbi:hypothetical protein DOTSEDRAFT_55307 [Dothistroma septosporum NZE10]|uniref:Uncharacterized protein n=1 Tax=Dothistroma septosporum (strain NZE10 / CBS 128990) TaxID=675120 RepID=N1PIX9_DOTSN|nr:hypothetical protein DOTSEDRAFT_55307 [Dothistroma septosporum NZE10]
MSIIDRSAPINLQYRICIVTSASSPLGVVISKTLLKANAFVLGVDTKPIDPSLNAGLGTHFQFEQLDVEEEGQTPKRLIEAAKEKFGLENIDALVNIFGKQNDGRGLGKLSTALGQVMAQQKKGTIVNVRDNVENEDGKQQERLLDFTKNISQRLENEGVRCNAVVLQAPPNAGQYQSGKAYEEAQTHMKTLMNIEKLQATPASTKAAPKMYDVGNVILFLAGDMSSGIRSSAVLTDGSYTSLE